MQQETVIVLDFGGQYNQLIARRVREQGVYSVVKSYRTPLEEIREAGYKGIIFTGGPNSVYDEESPRYQREILDLGVPVLSMHAPFEVVSKIDVYMAHRAFSALMGRNV